MVQKHIVISIIAPVAVAGILIMAILTATVNAQESNNTGNAQQQSNSTENGQESSNPGNATSPSESMASNTGNEQQESNNTGNATSTGATVNNNTGTTQVNNSTGTTQVNNSTGKESADFVNTILAVHNRERAAASVTPLVWNDTLAAEAKTWAEHLVATGTFEHDTPIFAKGEGENLATGPGDTALLMQGWVNEKNNWHGGPITAETPFAVWGSSIGHYVQMVSPATAHVGCGTASDKLYGTILDCRYDRSLFPKEPYIAPFLSRLSG